MRTAGMARLGLVTRCPHRLEFLAESHSVWLPLQGFPRGLEVGAPAQERGGGWQSSEKQSVIGLPRVIG